MKRSYAHTMRAVLAKVLVFAMVMMAFAVIAPKATAQAAAKPVMTKTSRNIMEGDLYDLGVKNVTAGSTYVWKTSNKKVATVDQDGIVVAKSKGNATITCTVTDTKKKTYKLTCKVTVIKTAKSLSISNAATVLNLGQKYDLDTILVPLKSNDIVSWTSDDKTIAAIDKKGVVTALKKGTVKITAKTLSGKTASTSIEVVDEEGLVATQAELNKFLGSGAGVITLKTDATENFVIPQGSYANQKLIVDAPNADVHNNGVFSSIVIKNIKENTWYEGTKGNRIEITANKVRIIVSAGASAAIEVKKVDGKLVIVNDGIIEELTVEAAANIEILGDSKEPVPVISEVEGVTVTTNVPLDLTCKKPMSLILNKGAEGTTISAESKDLIPSISGTVAVTISVGPSDGSAQAEVIVKQPAAGPAQGGAGGPGGGGPGGPTGPTNGYATRSGNTFTLGGELSAVKTVTVEYGALSWNISGEMLNKLRGYLANDTETVNTWKAITDSTNNDFGGFSAQVTGSAGSMNKSVTLNLGGIVNKTYSVSISGGTITVRTPSGVTYTITKSADNKSLTIENAPSDLKFYINY